MTKITIEVPDTQAKMWAYFLQQKYNTTQTDLNKLAEMAILLEVAKSAKDILDITEGNLAAVETFDKYVPTKTNGEPFAKTTGDQK